MEIYSRDVILQQNHSLCFLHLNMYQTFLLVNGCNYLCKSICYHDLFLVNNLGRHMYLNGLLLSMHQRTFLKFILGPSNLAFNGLCIQYQPSSKSLYSCLINHLLHWSFLFFFKFENSLSFVFFVFLSSIYSTSIYLSTFLCWFKLA